MAMNNKTDYPEEEGEGEGATPARGLGKERFSKFMLILLVKQRKFLKCLV